MKIVIKNIWWDNNIGWGYEFKATTTINGYEVNFTGRVTAGYITSVELNVKNEITLKEFEKLKEKAQEKLEEIKQILKVK